MNTMPNFFIVGAARSGTTSLDQYIRQHPEIYMAPKKETHYFAVNQFPSCFKGPGDDNLNRRIVREMAQYSQLFDNTGGKKAIGEASVFYLCSPGTAERIAQAVPDAKIIMILREPVARAYSSYMLLIRDGRETLGFAEGLTLEEERKQKDFEPIWWYKELSLYYKQVKRYLDVFGIQQVKVLLYEELFTNPKPVFRDIFTFLGVNGDVAIDTSVRHGITGVPKSRRLYTLLDNFINNPSPLGKRISSLVPLQLRAPWASKTLEKILQPIPINSQTHAQLKEYFAEDVGNLGDLLHRDLSSWHIASPTDRTES
jgi:hypothetical protein